jgi:hypothetical protein
MALSTGTTLPLHHAQSHRGDCSTGMRDFTVKIAAACFSETISTYQTARRLVPEDSNLEVYLKLGSSTSSFSWLP